jgi:hypothetical protein
VCWRTVDIASNGGLANGIGTFGWKIVTTNNDTVLFQGSCPIDGPAEVDSSTCSELGGYAAPLLLATLLARFWGIQHRCHFRWFTGSTSAISKVQTIPGAFRLCYYNHGIDRRIETADYS